MEKSNQQIDEAVKNKILHLHEGWLIKKWRNDYRFSEITIITQNGIPLRIKRVITNENPKDEGIRIP